MALLFRVATDSARSWARRMLSVSPQRASRKRTLHAGQYQIWALLAPCAVFAAVGVFLLLLYFRRAWLEANHSARLVAVLLPAPPGAAGAGAAAVPGQAASPAQAPRPNVHWAAGAAPRVAAPPQCRNVRDRYPMMPHPFEILIKIWICLAFI